MSSPTLTFASQCSLTVFLNASFVKEHATVLWSLPWAHNGSDSQYLETQKNQDVNI